MDTLHKAIEETLMEVPHNLLADLVRKKLQAEGVELSPKEFKLLQDHLRSGKLDAIAFKPELEQHKSVHITVTEEETKKLIERLETFLNDGLSKVLEKSQIKAAELIFATLKSKWEEERSLQELEIAGFQSRLKDRWQVPLSKLQMLITLAREFGSNINAALRSEPDSSQPDLIEVLTRLHARACQIVEEIECLLESGFADGAMARWRTLHEIAVTALFIESRGNKVAQRYIAHQAVESYKAATEYRLWQEKLGLDSITDESFTELEKSYNDALKKFGGAFRFTYGWAAAALAKGDPQFIDIEKAARIEHLRPYFRMASHNVHANPKGVFFKLGLAAETKILLSGPSNAGLADPGHAAAVSLLQVSSALCSLRPTFDNQVALRIMMLLEQETGDAFLAAHKELEENERQARKNRGA